MFNKVVLLGNLTRDIEMRYAPSGSAIGSSAIAVTRRFSANNGEKREETCFIDITFFGRTAEIANQYLSKGSKILVEGRLKFDQWNDQNGQNRSKHSVYVENLEMLGSNINQGQNNFNNAPGQSTYTTYEQHQSFDPYTANQNSNTPNRNSQSQRQPQQEAKLKEIDVDNYDDDSELPF